MRQKSNLITRTVGGETIVLSADGDNINRVLTLNGSGGFIWRLLEEDRSPEELTALAAAEYNIPEDTAREDITELLNTIKDYIE